MSGLLLLLIVPLVSSYPHFGLGLSSSVDIVQETKTQAESLKTILRYLASTPETAQFLNKFINDNNNVCLNSVDDVIEDIEESTKIVKNAAPEMKQLIKTVRAFEKLTDTAAIVRETANILRLLEVLLPKITPSPRFVCGASNAEAFGSLRNLAILVDELSSNFTHYLPLKTRQELKTSAKFISGVTTFLTQLNKSYSKFDKFCTSDKEYNIEAITAIGEMMTDLADLFGVLVGSSEAEQIRKQGDFTHKVVVSRIGSIDLKHLILCLFRPRSTSLEILTLAPLSATSRALSRWQLKLWMILLFLLMMLELRTCVSSLVSRTAHFNSFYVKPNSYQELVPKYNVVQYNQIYIYIQDPCSYNLVSTIDEYLDSFFYVLQKILTRTVNQFLINRWQHCHSVLLILKNSILHLSCASYLTKISFISILLISFYAQE